MLCPICKTKLVTTKKARLETLEEHVCCVDKISLKDAYNCPNISCQANIFKLLWSESGDCYFTGCRDNLNFIDGNNAPFGTINRKIYVEVYKHDEDKTIRIGKFMLRRVFSYESDYDGNILSKKSRLQFFYNGVLYISGLRMFIFILKEFYHLRRALKNNPSDVNRDEMRRMLKRNWDKRIWYKLFQIYVRLIHNKFFNNIFLNKIS